jgi:hypothetical protein
MPARKNLHLFRCVTRASIPFTSLIHQHHRERQKEMLLLNKVYHPFHNLQKGSNEYNRLAQSGECWESYFKPLEWTVKDEVWSQLLSHGFALN